ncbi:MAG: phage integrase SAM-like domain-containing protein, partial [Firmicutes bacterium]|nr:phage integrase SAM-like domain-containing protein [Bacillota bacterium]
MAEAYALQQNTRSSMLASASYSDSEILSVLIENGIVDPDGVRNIMNKKRTEKLLSYHNHKIWKGEDGRWRTFLPDPDKPKGRKLVSRASEEELKNLLCEYYSDQEEELRKKSLTLSDLFEEWLAYKGKRFSKSTIERNRSTWKSLYAGEQIISIPICYLTSDMISDWMEEKITEKKMNKHQYNSFSSVIRQMMDYAVRIGIIDSNPVEVIRIMNRELRPEPKKSSE